MTQQDTQKIVPVILCGGSGTRLAPMSTPDNPKQFLNLMNDYSLLQNTALRSMELGGIDASRVVTVTLDRLVTETNNQLNKVDEQ